MTVMLWCGPGAALVRLGLPAAGIQRPDDVVVGHPRLRWDCEFDSDHEAPPADARVLGLAEAPPDVVVTHAPYQRWALDALVHLQKAGVRVVVDVDDLYDDARLRNDLEGSHRGLAMADEACRMADIVTASTPVLARRFGFGHSVVLPNLVPEYYLTIDPKERRNEIGWTGAASYHPGDLESTNGAVGRVLAVHDEWRMGVLGEKPENAPQIKAALGLRSEPALQGFVDLQEYPHRMAEFGVGIVPLADNSFNRAKSALKLSQFAALGVPVVASPTPDNRRVHNLGVGMLAQSPSQWRRKLNLLVGNEDARAELAGKGRDVMATQTYESHCGRWWEAWTGEVTPLLRS